MASISEEFPGDCFDFDRLSACSLGGSVLKRELSHLAAADLFRARALSLVHGKIFHFVDPFQQRNVFSKKFLSEFCQLQPIQRS